jgi:shikimate dehydrogenase
LRFAHLTGEHISYDRLLVEPGSFARSVRLFLAEGGKGANVTLPFKVDAYGFASELTPRAEKAGAVNTLTLRGSAVLGDNTDGEGLVRDLTANLGFKIEAKRILILGAGGAARGVIAPLLSCCPSLLVVANRTRQSSIELAMRFREDGPIVGVGWDEIGEGFDLVVNATSAAIRGESLALPRRLFAQGATAYDMTYGPPARGFVHSARAAGAKASDGLGMLVEQAAESFLVWRGKRPDTASVIASLRVA